MKRCLPVPFTAAAVLLLAWQGFSSLPAQGQSTASGLPFADGDSFLANSASANIFAWQANGPYLHLQVSSHPPYSLLSPPSTLIQLFAGGLNNLLAAPAGPAGVGLESQKFALANIDGAGSLGVAEVGGSVAVVYKLSASLTTHSDAFYNVGDDANSVSFADLNGDGKPDLVVGYDGSFSPTSGGIAILLNKGDGTFAPPVTYALGTPTTHFALLDLNHDGILDIAAVALGDPVTQNFYATVLIGNGKGAFGAPMKFLIGNGPVGGSGQAIAIADIDGDGNPDLIVGGAAGILLGDGTGNFKAGTALPAVASGNQIWTFAAGDLNGDGRIDLVYEDIANQVVAAMFNQGGGIFQPGQTYAISPQPNSLVLADVNHDGRLDIVNASGDARIFGPAVNSSDLDILLNNGDQTFQGPITYFTLPNSEAGSNFTATSSMAVAHSKGAPPRLLATASGGLTLFPGDGKGGFLTPQSIPDSQASGTVVAADFNGDGIDDVAVAAGGDIAILLGNASGFGAATMIPSGTSFVTALTAGDFDGDGKVDLVAMGFGTLAFLKGNASGGFQAPVITSADTSPTLVSSVDLNGDSKLDLVFADSGTNGTGGGVFVALNAGGGAFQAPVNVFSGIFPGFGIGDVDGDGKLDLVVGADAAMGGVVDWLPGKGDGTFKAPVAITTTETNDNGIAVQDFNGDGHADVVLAQLSADTRFLAGNGDGTFAEPIVFNSTYEPTLLLGTDLNGDGKPDLIVGGATITVLLNNANPVATTVNSASFTGPVAVGSIATAFGSDLADASGTSTITLTDSAGVTRPCALFSAVPLQVSFLIPASAALGSATLTVKSGDGTVSSGSLTLVTAAPGIYAASGLAAALLATANADGSNQMVTPLVSVNSSNALVTAPINLDPPGKLVFLELYGTGISGAPMSQVTVQVGGQTLTPSYAGAAPLYMGEDQVNVQLPYSLKGTGTTAVTVTAAGQVSNTVHIQIQ